MQRLSPTRLTQWGFVLVALLSFVSARAVASTICHGDCPDDGDNGRFAASLRPGDGDGLKIRTSGTIYILGRFTTSGGDIRMRAENNLTIDVPDLDFIGIDVFLTGEQSLDIKSLGTEIPPIETGPRIGGDGSISIGGDVTLASHNANLQTIVAASVTSATNDLECLNFFGDVFLDLSDLTLGVLDIAAGEDIIWSLESPVVIPEPSTALFVGLGLCLLGTRRGVRAR